MSSRSARGDTMNYLPWIQNSGSSESFSKLQLFDLRNRNMQHARKTSSASQQIFKNVPYLFSLKVVIVPAKIKQKQTPAFARYQHTFCIVFFLNFSMYKNSFWCFVSDAERRGGERELLAATVRKMPRVLHRRSQPWTSGISVQGLRDVIRVPI